MQYSLLSRLSARKGQLPDLDVCRRIMSLRNWGSGVGRKQKGLSLHGKRIMAVTRNCCSERVSGHGAGRSVSCHPLSDSSQTAAMFTAGRSGSKYS